MPQRSAKEKAKQDRREGKSPSTQASEFVREEVHHVREGKHGARSRQQIIAIGLSKARKAGVKIPSKNGNQKQGRAIRKRRTRKTEGTKRARRRK